MQKLEHIEDDEESPDLLRPKNIYCFQINAHKKAPSTTK